MQRCACLLACLLALVVLGWKRNVTYVPEMKRTRTRWYFETETERKRVSLAFGGGENTTRIADPVVLGRTGVLGLALA